MTKSPRKSSGNSRNRRDDALKNRHQKFRIERLEDRRLLAVVSHWAADNTAVDSVGFNDGTLVSGASYATGQIGQAFSFDGVDDRVLVADDPSLELTASMTIEAWVKADSFTSGDGFILVRGDDRGGLDPYQLRTRFEGSIQFQIRDATNSAASVSAPMPLGEFVYVAATLDDATGEMRLYLNGVQMSQIVTTIRPFGALDPASNPSIGIGNHGGYPTTPHNFPFDGLIDELKVHDQALSAADVLENFNADKGSLQPSLSISDETVVEGVATTQLVNDFVGSQSGGLVDPRGIAFGPGGDLFVAASQPAQILRFDGATGAFEGVFADASAGADPRTGDVVFNGNFMYVTTAKNNSVLRFNALTGAAAPAAGQAGATFVTPGAGGLDRAFGMDFGPDGNLYLTSQVTDNVLRYNGATGVFIDVFVATGSNGLDQPNDLLFGPGGNLYVASSRTDQVLRFQGPGGGNPGDFVDTFVSAQSGGLDFPPAAGLAFSADGDLYVSSRSTNQVLRYDGTSGAFVGSIAVAIEGSLSAPKGLAFDAAGRLYVASGGSDEILRSDDLSAPVFVVRLSSPNPNAVTVNYATADVTASAGNDYTAASGTVVFEPGVTSKAIIVPIIDDAIPEQTETFNVTLSSPVGATITDGQGEASIVDNDAITAPRITDVIVGSSVWTNAAFIDAVDGGGTGSGNGLGMSLVGANQLDNQAWINIDKIYIQFSSDVSASFTASNMALIGTNVTDYKPLSTLTYGVDGTNVGTISLSTPIAADALILSLLDSLTDSAGNKLDGEWTDGSSLVSRDGTSGGRFNFRFDVLPGDVNNTNGVNLVDLLATYGRNSTLVSNLEQARYDVNGTGGVNLIDMLAVYARNNTILPAPPSLPSSRAPAGRGPMSPTGIIQPTGDNTPGPVVVQFGLNDHGLHRLNETDLNDRIPAIDGALAEFDYGQSVRTRQAISSERDRAALVETERPGPTDFDAPLIHELVEDWDMESFADE